MPRYNVRLYLTFSSSFFVRPFAYTRVFRPASSSFGIRMRSHCFGSSKRLQETWKQWLLHLKSERSAGSQPHQDVGYTLYPRGTCMNANHSENLLRLYNEITHRKLRRTQNLSLSFIPVCIPCT